MTGNIIQYLYEEGKKTFTQTKNVTEENQDNVQMLNVYNYKQPN